MALEVARYLGWLVITLIYLMRLGLEGIVTGKGIFPKPD